MVTKVAFDNINYIIIRNAVQDNYFFLLHKLGYRVLDAFWFEDRTQIFGSCSAVLNGEMLVFGGSGGPYYRQWSSVDFCSLRSERRKLPFDFYFGACNTIQVKFFRPHTKNYTICKQTIEKFNEPCKSVF